MAGWYRTGTVSLATGSAGVVGNGTSWAGAVRPGATFTTDFVRLYEVMEVADDRHLTLDRPYETSVETFLEGGGQPYAIIFATATMSNAEIAAELMAMVGKWQVREDQYDDWVAGEPDGGPNGDGKYPLTDSKGVTRLVTSPGRLLGLIDEGLLNNVQQVVDAIRDDIADAQRAADVAASAAVTLKEYADSAHQSGISAGEAMASAAASADLAGRKTVEVLDAAAAAANHAETAVQARTGAEAAVSIVTTAKTETLTARDGAVEAKATVVVARDRVQVLAGETQTARDTVVASTGTAAAAARTATDAAGTAQNAATDSVNAKVQAVAAQVVAEQRRNEAAESAATAKAWANNPAGVPVVSGGYSSYHWMELARGYAMTAQTIATGSTFSNVGDGAATRITAQAAGETLHLVQGAGMIVNFDQATRRVTFSSIARAVATESPALTVRLDDAANLAFLGIDPSKIAHGSLAGVGTHGHADIDQHLDNATIHVPVPGNGDVDKLLKATGAGTFAWVKGTGSGIDADKLDGLSWEEGVEVPANGASGEWVKLGTWNANGATAQGRRLLIQAAGSFDYSNDTANTRAGLTTLVATMGNGLPGVANMEGQFAHLGTVLFDAVKFVQGDGDRYTYAVYAKRQPYAPFNFKVQCNGAWTSAVATGQADPGADSATVRAAANLGRLLTTADQSTTAMAGGVVQRDANGAIAATAADLKGPAPVLHWSETDQPANAGRWRAIAENGKLAFQTVNDAAGDARTWLEVGRSGLAPTAATFSVPVQVALGQLGTAAGAAITHADLGANDGNADFLRAKLVRVQAGTNWTSAAWRLQRSVDVTDQGFVQFGSGVAGDGSNGVGLGGGGSTVRLWVPTVGDVTIDSNKVWTAGNFDPASKAGTAVATVAANGLMAAADRQVLGGATAAATAGALVVRDNAGAAAFAGLKVAGYDVWHAGTLNGAWLGQDVRPMASPTFGGVTATAGFVAATNDGFRHKQSGSAAGIGIVHRNDGANYYMLLTASGDANGTWNSLRPFRMDLSTGQIAFAEGIAGNLTLKSGDFYIDRAAGSGKYVRLTSSGTNRWLFGADSAAEAGSNAGANFLLNRYDDAGNYLGTPVGISRGTGKMSISEGLGVNGFAHIGSATAAVNSEVLLLSPGGSPATGQNIKIGIRNSGSGDGSPNAVFLGVDGAALSGRAYIDTRAYGVAAPTPLDLRINGVTRATLGTNGVMDFKEAPTVNDVPVLTEADAGVRMYRNRIINPRFMVCQRGTATFTTGGIHSDRWHTSASPTLHSILTPASHDRQAMWNRLHVTTAKPSLAADDLIFWQQVLEGFTVEDFAFGTAQAKSVTLSFDFDTNVAGTYAASLRNGSASLAHIKTFTVPAGRSRVSVTFPGCTTGTWAIDNGAGIIAAVTVATGSRYTTGTPNAWINGNYVSATGTTNLYAAMNNYAAITNVVLEAGTKATPIASCSVPLDEEYRRCWRYFQSFNGMIRWAGHQQAGGTIAHTLNFFVPMRITPTINVANFQATVNTSNFYYYLTNFCMALTTNAVATGGYDIQSLQLQFSAEVY